MVITYLTDMMPFREHINPDAPKCIIAEDKNDGKRKGYPNLEQTFQTEFNELFFISIVLKLNRIFLDSLHN